MDVLLRERRMALTRGQRGGSMYAVFVEVNAGAGPNDQARQNIEGNAVPIDSEEAARRAADQLKVGEAPPGGAPGVTFRTVEVREVLASL